MYMKTIFNCVATLAAVLPLAGCAPHLSRAPAAASAASPGAPSLAGRDPYDTGCAADARTTATAPTLDASGRVLAVVELRRSDHCQTAWARAVRISGVTGTLAASVRVVGASSSFEHPTDGEVWTDMVPWARACATATGGVRRPAIQEARATSCDDTGGESRASE